MLIENIMVIIPKHSKVIIVIGSNRPYGEIASECVRRYEGMIKSCQVRGCTEVC